MLEILQRFNYSPPKLESSKFDNFEVIKNESNFTLKVDGQTWMQYYLWSHIQAAQVFSHYYLAKGKVTVTGLGFAARETWLLKNPNVDSLTIIEANNTVIDFHRKQKTPVLDHAEVICCRAEEYKGECDTLLLDHYELETMEYILNDVYNVSNNIKHQTLWFWPLELKILADCHKQDANVIYQLFRENKFNFDMKALGNIKDIYDRIKILSNLDTLPNLSESELRMFVAIYSGFFQYL